MTQEAVQITTTPPLPGLQLVQDLNKALQTLGTDFAGPDDPAVMAWPYSTWADTGTGTLKRRNAANSAWMIEGALFEDVRLTASATDTTAGRVLTVGYGGLGGDRPTLDGIDVLDAANAALPPFYVTGVVNGPAGASGTAGFVDIDVRSGNWRRVTYRPYNSLQIWVNSYNGAAWTGWAELYHSDNVSALQWRMMPIGMPFPLDSRAPQPPTDDPTCRYVLLTAGQTGAGQYNAGILTGETVTGTSPLLEATATISLAGSPMDGMLIHHINTERRFTGAGTAGTFENDQLQNITGSSATPMFTQPNTQSATGALFHTGAGSRIGGSTNADLYGTAVINFDASRVARTGNVTQPRAWRTPYLMRIL